MPNSDEWRREIEDLVFDKSAVYSRPPTEEVGESSLADGDIAIDAVDVALLGTPASNTSTATDAEQHPAKPDVPAPVDVEHEPSEAEVPTTSVPMAMIFGTAPGDVELPEEEMPTRPVPVPLPLTLDEDEPGPVAAEEVGESSLADGDIAIDAVDVALLGTPASNTSTATDAEQHPAKPDVPAPVDVEHEPSEAEVPTTSVPMAMIFGTAPGDVELPEKEMPTRPVPVPLPLTLDEDEPGPVAPESSDECVAPLAAGNDRGRRRVRMVACLALAVVIGATVGAVALIGASDPRPAGRTAAESITPTSTTAPTTTVATTTPPTPETSTPVPTPPTPLLAPETPATASPSPRTAPTAPSSARPPGPAPTNPTPPGPAPPNAAPPVPAPPNAAPPVPAPPNAAPPASAPQNPAPPAPAPEPAPPPTSPPPTSSPPLLTLPPPLTLPL
jgi:hypothetical protein